MAGYKKTLEKVLLGTSDANIRFGDLRSMLTALGFEERIKGGHHIFTLKGREAALNVQPDGSKAKAYQVKQIRQIIIEHKLASDEEAE
ncbi:MAG TPA: type II toxin-antitoxin system HicA family toxin [Gemmatimonadota bacterium]|nr:type II toxin-antitoxin system HicA family toxin [Gemmatimonadota bacterium]